MPHHENGAALEKLSVTIKVAIGEGTAQAKKTVTV